MKNFEKLRSKNSAHSLDGMALLVQLVKIIICVFSSDVSDVSAKQTNCEKTFKPKLNKDCDMRF